MSYFVPEILREFQADCSHFLATEAADNGIISAWSMANPMHDAGGVCPMLPTNSPPRTQSGVGVGYALNGSTHYLLGTENPQWAFNTGDFLLAASFRTTASSISMLVARSDGSGTAYYLATDSTGKMRVDIASAGAILSNSVWNDGKDHTCVMARRAGIIEFYVDGKYDGGGTRSNAITGTGKAVLGRYGTSSSFYFAGNIYGAAIGNKASSRELCAQWSRGLGRLFAPNLVNAWMNVPVGGAFKAAWALPRTKMI